MLFDYLIKSFRSRINSNTIFQKFTSSEKVFNFAVIGGYDGLSFDNLIHWLEKMHVQGIIIEPIPCHFEQLSNNMRNFTDITLLKLAIHNSLKKNIIYKIKEKYNDDFPDWIKGCSSFQKDHLLKHGLIDQNIESLEVDCISINQALEKLRDYKNIDYLQIDCEGYDGQILLDLNLKQFSPSVIKFEHINLNQDELSKVIVKLKKNNYFLNNEGDNCLAVKNTFFLKIAIK